MNVVAQTELLDRLRARGDAIASRWYRAIAPTGFVPLEAGSVRQRLRELVDQAAGLLLAEPFERGEARGIGAALVGLHYGHPDALGRTQEVLAEQLLAELPAETAVALLPRLAALLGELAIGFSGAARDAILAQQESIRGALLAARQQVEDALRASEARFRAVFEGAAIGISVANFSGQLLDANPAMEEMFGYSAEEFRRTPITDFTHPDDATTDWQLYHELMSAQREHFRIEKRFIRKDGRLVWTNLTASLVRDDDGRPLFSIGMMEDITERKQAEETIRQLNADLERRVTERTAQLTDLNHELIGEIARRTQAETERLQLLAREQAARAEAEAAQQRLTFLAGASSALAASLDFKTTLTSVAQLAVPTLADWCAVDVLGEQGALQRLAVAHVDLAKVELVRELEGHQPAEPDALSGVMAALRTGRPEFLPEVPDSVRLLADEAYRRHLAALRPTSRITVPLIARGRTLGTISLVLAESGRRYSPTDLTLADDLARRAAVAIDNARLYREAHEALAARDIFLSIAAHELRTPITSVRGYTELALRQFARPGGADAKRVERSLGALERESEKLSHLVARLLDLSRIGSGQLALDRTPTDIASLVRELAANAQLTTSQHTIAVRAPASVQALVDPLRLEQVVTNLLSNAIKYSPRGGPIDIEVAAPDPGTVCIGVRDHGVGIPAELQQRLFERFYQTRAGDRVAGLGLGLYISRQIVTLHGGRIGVESPPDGGTRFTVCLPTSPVGRKEHEGLGA